MWQIFTLKCRPWILYEQSLRLFFTEALLDKIVRWFQTKGPRSGVVRIASHKMDQAFTNPPKRMLLSGLAKHSSKRAGSHLHVTSKPYPTGQTLRVFPESGREVGVGRRSRR